MRATFNATISKSQNTIREYIRFGWPIASLVALVGLAVFVLLADIARDQDNTYETTTRNFVAQSTANWVETNAAISNEYSLWNDAYENITLRDDQQWMKDNYFSENASAVAIVRPNVGLRFIFINENSATLTDVLKSYSYSMETYEHKAYQLNPSKQSIKITPKGIFRMGDNLASVAAQPIRPDANYTGKLPSAGQPIDLIITIQIIDSTKVEAISKSFGLRDVKLHLGPRQGSMASGRIAFDIVSNSGEYLGWIDWAHLKPGSTAFTQRILPISIGLAFVGFLTLLVTYRLLANQVKLSEAAQKSAEEASKTKSNFLANISHELRTPLNAIIGYSEIIEEDCLQTGATQTATDAHKVIGSAQHLLGLINDLLDHSKIEAGKMDLNPTLIELAPLFVGVGDALSSVIAKNNSQFVLNIDPLIGDAVLDGMRLKQCLLNLVSNAAKFTHDGVITLSARAVHQNGVEHLRIAVRDSGIGMSGETLGRLFAPFVQAEASTASKFGGTGLGLVITRALIEAMGGSVAVESQLGEGSTFIILIPRGIDWAETQVPAQENVAIAA
jgi:signal transduction histidine kinase